MELIIKNGKEFVDNFIGGLSKISDTGILKLANKKFTCLTATADNTIVINSEYIDSSIDEKDTLTLNIPDFKKLHKLLSILPDSFTLQVNANNIAYSSSDTRFKYHLYEEGIISSPAINISKISSIPFSCIFQTTVESIRGLMKSSFLLPDITKVYFNFNDGVVQGEITDKSRHNVDSFSKLLSHSYGGDIIAASVPINIEILRLLSSSNVNNINVEYSKEYSILLFEVVSPNIQTKYIVSGLIN
jgi:hypothetical protein